MKLSLELFKGKQLVDGTYPIAIRASHNGKNKYKMCGISAHEKYWNNIKKRLTCRAESFREKNEIINRKYQEINSRIEWFKQNDIEYDLDFIFSNKRLESYFVINDFTDDYNTENFIDIIRARIDNYSKIKTKENYKAFLNVMIKLYGNTININKINQSFAISFRNRIDDAGYSSNHKNSLIKCFTSCYKFGAENRWITNPYVITIKKFEHQSENRDITYNELTKIIQCYKKELQVPSENFARYKSLALFILDIAFHGLSPIDLAKIKIKDLKLELIEEIDVNNELYFNDINYKQYIENNQSTRYVISVNVNRSKTGKNVPITIDYFTIRHLLYNFCIGKNREDYLIDCFNINKQYTEKQLHNRCGNYFMQNAIRLNEYLRSWDINSKITYYIARHSFINALDNMNIPHSLIKKMVGHKDSTLEKAYINKPTKWEQSLLTYKIFNQIETIEKLEIRGKGYECCEYQWSRLEQFLLGNLQIL